MRKFHYVNTGQISCEAIHPEILNVPIDVAVNFTYSRNVVNVYVAAKLLAMESRGRVNVSMSVLADRVNLSEKTVKKAIDELGEIGYVKQIPRWVYVPHNPDYSSTEYVVEPPDVDEHHGSLSRRKDMYIFLEKSWREFDADGEEI